MLNKTIEKKLCRMIFYDASLIGVLGRLCPLPQKKAGKPAPENHSQKISC
jgi:hypothetical protein